METGESMIGLWQDIVFGIRIMLKQPGFTIGAVLTLALGIGVNSAIFNVVSAFIIRPIPGAAEPEQLVVPFNLDRDGDLNDSFSYPNFVDYRDRNRTMDGLFAYRLVSVVLGEADGNDVIYGEMVSGNYFDVLRVKAQHGRTFLPEESRTPNTHPVVVISHDLWISRLGSDPGIVGRTLRLNGSDYNIIGIAPEQFQGTKWGLGMDFWVPLMMENRIMPGEKRLSQRGWSWLQIMGRLKKGISADQAEKDMSAVTAQLDREFASDRGVGNRIRLLPETEGRFDHISKVVSLGSGVALGVVGVILLIVCANLANLMLARAQRRRREIGIRLALGANRGRLISQLMTESLMLALLGGAVGFVVSFWISDLVILMAPVLPYRMILNLAPDMGVILFTLLVSILAGLIFGLVPALQSSRLDLVTILKGDESRMPMHRSTFNLRTILVVAQVTLSMIVLVCSGLMIRSFQNATKIDPGFDPQSVTAMTITPGLLGYDEVRGKLFYSRFLERVKALPGVETASYASLLPLGDSSNSTGPVIAEGQPDPQPGEGLNVLNNVVGPDYFRTMRTPILQGREFETIDRSGQIREVVINQTLAGRLWPGQNAIGRIFRISNGTARYQVVGVVKDGKYRSLSEQPRPHFWYSAAYNYEPQMTLLVRTSQDSPNIVAGIRQALKGIDAAIPLVGIKTMREHMTVQLWGTRMGAGAALGFGILVLIIAAMGIYSVISYSVSQRTKELGIRMALGANRKDVIRLVAVQGVKVALIGILVGLPLAFLITRLLSNLLFDVSVVDPLIFGGISLLLIIVGWLAGWIPARRASRVDPMVALRYE